MDDLDLDMRIVTRQWEKDEKLLSPLSTIAAASTKTFEGNIDDKLVLENTGVLGDLRQSRRPLSYFGNLVVDLYNKAKDELSENEYYSFILSLRGVGYLEVRTR